MSEGGHSSEKRFRSLECLTSTFGKELPHRLFFMVNMAALRNPLRTLLFGILLSCLHQENSNAFSFPVAARSQRHQARRPERINFKYNQLTLEDRKHGIRPKKDGTSNCPRRTHFGRKLTFAAIFVVVTCTLRVPAAFAVTSNSSRLPAMLGSKQLLVGATLVSTFGGIIMSRIGLHQLAREILLACVRSTAQLFLLGGFILQRIFGTSRPAVVWMWIVSVGFLAAQEASSRVEYAYSNLRRHLTISVLSSGIGILALSLAGKVFGDIHPWYQPRTLIPVSGMLFGNTLSATSLAASSLTRNFAQSSSHVELRLSRGATSQEAVMPIVKSSLYSALTPTVNSLAATGVVHMPGMMTGQVLSGQSPSQAAAYQVLILFLITATACSTVQLLARFVSHELINWEEDRLQISELVRVSKASPKDPISFRAPLRSIRNVASSIFQHPPNQQKAARPSKSTKLLVPSVIPIRSSSNASSSPVLKVDQVQVERANMVVSFNLSPGERIGITGSSGIGKTQILRTLAGLEHCQGEMELSGVDPSKDQKWPEWRRQVCWVSQDRTTLDGTPREFFEEIRTYHTQQRALNILNPEDIAASWGLPFSVFDRPWSTLSGGEAQRASLAIALSFKPQVLLLDEITAGLDEDTERAVENTLAASDVPIVMVTHSRTQLDRFCTHHMDLNGATVMVS